ncbi:hypothetical protein [Candidatus Vampirococcus lugosii]|uniref:Response regulatory domain-containing protein n=1 Tax=Candidatus Vampirococcus lugosii TaxID=2789015 RepID=A0ABS5QNC6_9BACT|nr:hypothetical protein [Candidatus Vampirococcus lugosii]MBS8121954.1 hypothetical protein [Candidatus Vampirococcus lugosii]
MLIGLIDDKDYGIEQIKKSVPNNIKYKFKHFFSYKDAIKETFDILFLDYYLDKDGVKGKEVIQLMEANIIIGFSSVPECNNILLIKGADYGITKLKSDDNEDLNKLMKTIL